MEKNHWVVGVISLMPASSQVKSSQVSSAAGDHRTCLYGTSLQVTKQGGGEQMRPSLDRGGRLERMTLSQSDGAQMRPPSSSSLIWYGATMPCSESAGQCGAETSDEQCGGWEHGGWECGGCSVAAGSSPVWR